jgi:hypothetical protein
MDTTELEQRKARAASETLVIAPTEGGFRVYNPANITHIYMVSGIPDLPKCNCPDFETHKDDPDWRCKHILAVLNQITKREGSPISADTANQKEDKRADHATRDSSEKRRPKLPRNDIDSHMLIKRSVSPDGKINSMSIEFVKLLDVANEEEVRQGAETALKIQENIVRKFLAQNDNRPLAGEPTKTDDTGSGNERRATENQPSLAPKSTDGALPAQLLNVAGMNTRSGWRLFINVQVNGVTAKLFGSKRQLAEHVLEAGFKSVAENMSQGMMLNLPCRVITSRSADGKYLNIERVLPLKPFEEGGGQ